MLNTNFSFDSTPIEVINIEIWRDGGTISFTFVDAENRPMPCFVGGALRTDSGQLFIGDAGVSHGKAELIAPDDTIYKQVIFAIERHLIHRVGTPEQQEDFEREGFVRDTIAIDNEENREAWLLANALNSMQSRATSNDQI